MKNSKTKTLLIGLAAGVTYAFFSMLIISRFHGNVSVSYIFLLPVLLGAIPVLFSTKEQLKAYKSLLLWPWMITLTFFLLAYLTGFEGMICLTVIVAPFLICGTLGAFIFRLIRLKRETRGTKLYASLLLPFLLLFFEGRYAATDQINDVKTRIEIHATSAVVWDNVKNVRNIRREEIQPHFVHLIGVPRPLNGELDREGVGGVRHITWEKGIRFDETITAWSKGKGFVYDIHLDPHSIPPHTLDEHVMIGGRYFDVLKGSYRIDSLAPQKTVVTLTCTYRVTTSLNWYSKIWADFVLEDFNQMILEVIRKRSESVISPR